MAWSKVLTTVANPGTARKSKKRMATKTKKRRKLSAKQIRIFGTKAQKAALKRKRTAKRSNPSKRKRHTTRRHSRRVVARKNPVSRSRATTKRRSSRRRKGTAKRRNAGEIILLTAGNPAKRRTKSVAKKRYSKKRAGRKNPSSRRRSTTTRRHSRRTRRNPSIAGMRPMDLVKAGVGVIGGGVGTRLLPQLLMPSANVGATGYAMNAAAAIALTFATHAFTRDKALTFGVGAGGFAGLILRMVNDQSSVGKYLALSGMGDYLVSNWTQPQRITDPRGAMFEMGGGGGSMAAAVAARNGEDSSGNC